MKTKKRATRKIRLAAVSLALLMLLLPACSPNPSLTPYDTLAPGTTLKVGSGIEYLSSKTGAERQASEELSHDDIRAAADFAISLLKLSGKDENNELISPLSIMLALGMVTNGAWGDTRAEFEETLGMSAEELNGFLNSFVQSLKNSEKASLISANSVWVSNDRGLSVRADFIENVVRHYDAEIISAPFGNDKTLGEINGWVKDNTDGMIEKILEELSDDAVMLLLNALTFDAEWAEQFETEARDESFTNADGSKTNAKLMSGKTGQYIEGKNCVGFKKDYAGGAYSYIALLPEAGMSIDDFISSLDGKTFLSLVKNPEKSTVYIKLPKYKLDFSITLNDVLKELGIKSAFDDGADLSALGKMDTDANLYISQVLHKTHIEVDESGTRAAAVTAVIISPTSAVADPKTVNLDRPFVYAIVDNATGLPLFLGAVENIG